MTWLFFYLFFMQVENLFYQVSWLQSACYLSSSLADFVFFWLFLYLLTKERNSVVGDLLC